jgi:hypothetical protein
MKNGLARFQVFLDRVEKLLIDAAGQPDPAFWLYQNGARTPIFMLEGLAKLYGNIHNKKRFNKIEDQFKLLEDTLGAIDYYDNFAKDFSKDSSVPGAVTKAVQAKAAEKTELLNAILKKKNWIGEKAGRIGKIRKKLSDADWLEEKKELEAIRSVYLKSIEDITEFQSKYAAGFTELEGQVHELRRKLRWLSIYPQALQGAIQLSTAPSKDKNLKKYLTPEIVNSPFNKMPESGTNRYVMIFNKDYFLALSWMISELGKLKDEGLRSFVLNEVGERSPSDQKNEAAILSRATEICKVFFAEKNLDNLLKDIERTDDA